MTNIHNILTGSAPQLREISGPWLHQVPLTLRQTLGSRLLPVSSFAIDFPLRSNHRGFLDFCANWTYGQPVPMVTPFSTGRGMGMRIPLARSNQKEEQLPPPLHS